MLREEAKELIVMLVVRVGHEAVTDCLPKDAPFAGESFENNLPELTMLFAASQSRLAIWTPFKLGGNATTRYLSSCLMIGGAATGITYFQREPPTNTQHQDAIESDVGLIGHSLRVAADEGDNFASRLRTDSGAIVLPSLHSLICYAK